MSQIIMFLLRSHSSKVLGKEAVSFEAVSGVKASSLICIDVEYPDIWSKTMDTDPKILFNPCHIILWEGDAKTQLKMRNDALSQFSKKYEEHCHRLGLIMIR